jgi:hypothetical protein
MRIEVIALVFEVLPDFGLAHARVDDGRILGINKQTKGVVFDDLQVGQWLRCCVAERFSRVLQCRLVEPGDDPKRVVAPTGRTKSRCPEGGGPGHSSARCRQATMATAASHREQETGMGESSIRLPVSNDCIAPAQFARQLRLIRNVLTGSSIGIQWIFLTTPKGSLGGLTPLQALALGRYAEVRVTARGWVER